MSRSTHKSELCRCGLCKPETGKQYHHEFGFDLDAVKAVHCISCNKPIGEAKYVLNKSLARLGQMLFYHKVCSDRLDKADSKHRRTGSKLQQSSLNLGEKS